MLQLQSREIKELYLNKRMSSTDIAKRYGCCKATILKRLRIANVRMRPCGIARLKVSDDRLKELYVNNKLSTWKIAELLKCGRSTVHRKLAKSGLTRDIASAHIRYKRNRFSGDPFEKAYLIGFAIGDLRVRKVGKKSRTIKVDCGSTRKEQIELIHSLFSRYGRVWIGKPTESGKTQVEAFLDDSFCFLVGCRQNIDWALKKRYFMPFLAGFSDAEGSIFITNGKAGYSLGNYDRDLLRKIRVGLQERGIEPVYIYKAKKRYRTQDGYLQNRAYSHLKINRKKILLKLFNMLGPHMKHRKRKEDLRRAVRNIMLRRKN